MTNICSNYLELSIPKRCKKNFFTSEEGWVFNFNEEELLKWGTYSNNNYPIKDSICVEDYSYENISAISVERLLTIYMTFDTKWFAPVDLYKKMAALDYVGRLIAYYNEPERWVAWKIYYDWREESEDVFEGLAQKWDSLELIEEDYPKCVFSEFVPVVVKELPKEDSAFLKMYPREDNVLYTIPEYIEYVKKLLSEGKVNKEYLADDIGNVFFELDYTEQTVEEVLNQ